jgi:hypothetical protein
MLLNMVTYYLQNHYKQAVAKHRKDTFVQPTTWGEDPTPMSDEQHLD